MNQNSLFDEPLPAHCQPLHLARASDPQSSHQAAADVVVSGRRDKQLDAVLELLKLRPVSAIELVKVAVNYRARVSELRQLGHKIDVRKTVCAATGDKVFMYFLREGNA